MRLPTHAIGHARRMLTYAKPVNQKNLPYGPVDAWRQFIRVATMNALSQMTTHEATNPLTVKPQAILNVFILSRNIFVRACAQSAGASTGFVLTPLSLDMKTVKTLMTPAPVLTPLCG